MHLFQSRSPRSVCLPRLLAMLAHVATSDLYYKFLSQFCRFQYEPPFTVRYILYCDKNIVPCEVIAHIIFNCTLYKQ